MNLAHRKVHKSSVHMEENIERVLAMRNQEENGYLYSLYLPQRPDGSRDPRINVVWREKICQWSYNVVDQ